MPFGHLQPWGNISKCQISSTTKWNFCMDLRCQGLSLSYTGQQLSLGLASPASDHYSTCFGWGPAGRDGGVIYHDFTNAVIKTGRNIPRGMRSFHMWRSLGRERRVSLWGLILMEWDSGNSRTPYGHIKLSSLLRSHHLQYSRKGNAPLSI